MTFPVIATQANGAVTVNATAWSLTWPSGIAAGDLIIVLMGVDGTPTISSFSTGSWVTLGSAAGTAATALLGKMVAAGTESGSFTCNISASEQGIWQVLRITGWEGTLGTTWSNTSSAGGSVTRTGFSGTTVSANPPSLDPFNWATEDTLWLATSANDGTVTYSAKDANYTYVTGSPATSGGSGGAGLAVSWRQNAVSAEDPATYTLSGAEDWSTATIGIRPGAAVAAVIPELNMAPHRAP